MPLTTAQRRSLAARWYGRGTSNTAATGADGQVLSLNSDLVPEWVDATSLPVGGTHEVLDRVVADFDTAGNNTATQVYGYTIPGGTLANGDVLRLTLNGYVSNNDNGNNRTFTYRINFGGVTLYQPSAAHTFTGLTAFVRRTVRMVIEIGVVSQTSQILSGHLIYGPNSAPTTGFADWLTTSQTLDSVIHGVDSTVNLSSNRLLEVTVQPSSTVSTLHWVRRMAILERF